PTIRNRSYRAQLTIVVRGLADHRAASPAASRASEIAARRGEALCVRPSSAKRRQHVTNDRIRPSGHSQPFNASLTADSASREESHEEITVLPSSLVFSTKTRDKTAAATTRAKTDAPKRPFSIPNRKRRTDARKRHPAPNRGKMTVSERRSSMGGVQKRVRGQ
ncbi:MAG: hypothetical protein PVI07_04370, partial [Anaerolineae bacterium]